VDNFHTRTCSPSQKDLERWELSDPTIRPPREMLHLRVHDKGSKVQYLSFHPGTAELITDYLKAVGSRKNLGDMLLRPVKNNVDGTMEEAVTANGIYKTVKHCTKYIGETIESFGTHSL
jgi:hypothetical protein